MVSDQEPNRDDAAKCVEVGPRRVVVLAEKAWAGFFLTSTLKRSGVDVVALVVEREPTDGVAYSLKGWKRARKQVGLRRSSWAFFGMPMGGAYHLKGLVNRSGSPLLRDVWKLGIPIEEVEAFKSEQCHEALRRLRPDVTVICGTPILPESLLSIANICTLNIHTSILPHYRGGGSLFWPFFFRDTDKVGYTIHRAVADLDAGPFLHQEQIPVSPGDTPESLFKKCFRAASPLLANILLNDPLTADSWHAYDKPLAYVHRRPYPMVYRYQFPAPSRDAIKRVALSCLNGISRVIGGSRRSRGRFATFFIHRALADNTPPSDWRRVLGHPTASELRDRLVFLKQHYTFVSLSEWLERLTSSVPSPEDCAVLTVDDGYRDFRTGILPVVEEQNVPTSFFVCTGAVETNSVWYQRVYNLIHQVQSDRLWVPWMDTRVYFGDVRHRVLTVEYVLLAYLKRLSREQRQESVARLVEKDAASRAESPVDAFCDLNDLDFLKRSPLVELYPHGHEHDPFETLTDAELHNDLIACLRFFKDKLGLESRVLSYPNGRFKDSQRPVLSSLGIEYAFSTESGAEQAGRFDRLSIKRTSFGNESLAELSRRLRRLKLIG